MSTAGEENGYYQRALSYEETKQYYQDLIRECQQKINILDSQIESLNDQPTHRKIRDSYIEAREKNRKTVAVCRIYIFGLDKRSILPTSPPPPSQSKSTETNENENKPQHISSFDSIFQNPYQQGKRIINNNNNNRSKMKEEVNPGHQKRGGSPLKRVITGNYFYVNRKQYHRILKRRESRERFERLLSKFMNNDSGKMRNIHNNNNNNSINNNYTGRRRRVIPIPLPRHNKVREVNSSRQRRRVKKKDLLAQASKSGIQKSSKTKPPSKKRVLKII